MLAFSIHLPLAMPFIAPAFFWAGAGLVGIPILIHFLNRRRFKTVNWAAMEFLLRAMRKNRRRLKFEQWMLLATRCLLLLFLGLALARPVGCDQSTLASLAGQRSGLHVFVIDNSYSMAYEANRPDAKTHLEQVKLLAKAKIDRLSSGGESVALITASRPAAAALPKPVYDLEGAKSAIDRIEQSFGGTDLAGALQQALQIARDEPNELSKHLYLFTDATRSAWKTPQEQSVAQAGQELEKLYRITHFNLGRNEQWNHAALEVKPSSSVVTNFFQDDFITHVKGYGSGPDAYLEWKLDDRRLPGGNMVRLDLQTAEQKQSEAVFAAGGPHVITVNLQSDDRLKMDNARYRVVDVISQMKVLIVEGERGVGQLSGSGAYLEAALAPPGQSGGNNPGSYISPERISDLELGNKVLSDYRAVVLAGVGHVLPAQADQLQSFVRQGGTLLLFMGEPVNAENYNQVLLPRKLLPGPLVKQMNAAGDQKGFLFDFDPNGVLHPLLRIFSGEENSGLGTAQVFTYWQIEISVDSKAERVLNYLMGDRGSGIGSRGSQKDGMSISAPAPGPRSPIPDPAITVHSLGEGRVVFFSTSASADNWTSLPAKPAYVTLMHELLLGSVNIDDQWMNRLAGDSLELPPTLKLTASPILRDPLQKEIIIEPTTTERGEPIHRSPPLDLPGIYHLSTGGQNIPIAVNVPADEADVRTLDDGEIKKLLGDIEMQLEGDQLPIEQAAGEIGHDLGWSLMLIVLALVGVECFMAMRFGHYRR